MEARTYTFIGMIAGFIVFLLAMATHNVIVGKVGASVIIISLTVNACLAIRKELEDERNRIQNG